MLFGTGISAANLIIASDPADGNVMILRFADRSGSIRVPAQWLADSSIDIIQFADGGILAGDQIAAAFVAAQTITGNDVIWGSNGADVIAGSVGDDMLHGKGGNDTYRFGRGDGFDAILDRGDQYWWGYADGGFDAVEFKAGVAPSDIEIVAGPDDMVLRIRGTSDQLKLSGQVSTAGQRVEQVRFADGTVWTDADLRVRSLAPTPGDDVRYAGATSAVLEGGAGNDTLYGSHEADLLDGGTGNDRLEGNNGDDVYRFRRGDGSDTILDRGYQYWWGFGGGGHDAIEMQAGIDPADLDVVQTGPDDIVLKVRGTNDQLTLSGQVSDEARRIEEVRFASGTVWTASDILVRSLASTSGDDVRYAGYSASTMEGGAGNDSLYASGGNDVLDGGTGDDLLDGGYGGNDVYRFGRGDASDKIIDRGDQYWWGFGDGGYDVVQLRAGVVAADVFVIRAGDDLALRIRGTADRLTMTRALVDSAFRIEEVRFADGTVWSYEDLIARATSSDVQVGGFGDDTLVGDNGADRLYGDAIAYQQGTGPNLLVNGSFETSGSVVGGGGWGVANDTLPGWTKLNSQTFEQVYSGIGGVTATEGGFWLDMDSAGGAGSNMHIAQTVSGLDAGQQLALTFDHIGRTGNASSDLQVLWNGTVVATYRSYGSALQTDKLLLTAVAGDNVIAFRSLGAEDSSGAALDNVRLQGIASTPIGGNDVLSGGGGDDLLVGGPGDDALDGGAGADQLFGDLGPVRAISGPNLLANGSFEQIGPDASYNGWGVASHQLPGWTKANAARFNQVYSGIDGVVASDGTFVMDLDDAGGPGSNMDISQTVLGLSAGDTFLLTFDFGNANSVASGTFEVWWNDQILATIAEPGTQMREKQFEVVATAGANTLRFRGLGAEDGTNAQLDTVRLFATTPLQGGGGRDVLAGGAGTDLLVGGSGDDDYRFARGDGQDVIVEWNGEGDDELVFSADIAPGDVIVSGTGDADLIFAIRDTADGVTIRGFGFDNAFETIRFANGTTWSVAALMAQHHGRNRTLTIDGATTSTGAVSEIVSTTGSASMLTASGAIRFADPDAGDAHGATVTGLTMAGDTAGLPATGTMLGWFSNGSLTEPDGAVAGSSPWSFAAPDSAFDHLRAGQSVVLTYAVQIADDKGGSVAQNVALTIIGSNDGPSIASGTTASGGVTELASMAASNATASVSGTIMFADADIGDAHAASIAGVTATGATAGLPAKAELLGMANVGALTEPSGATAGSVDWSFAAADRTFDYLAAGQTVTLSYDVQISDGSGGTFSQPIAIIVTGTNDAPLMATGTTAVGAITERASLTGSATNDVASGAIRFTDLDAADLHAATINSVAATGVTAGLPSNRVLLSWLASGTVTEQSGATAGILPWTFAAPDTSFDYLGAGQTATLTYVVQLSDGKGGSFAQNVAVTITGTNDAPVVTVPGAQIARTSTPTMIFDVVIGDPDGNATTETVTLTTTLGTVAASARSGATVTGSASNSLQIAGTIAQVNATLATLTYTSTAAGSDTISVATSDGTVTTTKTIAVTARATANHAPKINSSTSAAGAITERAATYASATPDTATGTIRLRDADLSDTHTVAISSVTASGVTSGLPDNAILLGYLTNGLVTEPTSTTSGAVTWTFSAPDRTFDYLGAGQVATLSYVVTVTDSQSTSTTQTVTITATGTNDAAVLATGSATTAAITEIAGAWGAATNDTASGVIRFTDEPGNTQSSATIADVGASGMVTGLPASATMLAWLTMGALTQQSGTTAGSLPWTFAAPDSAFDYLSAGQTVTLTYTLQVADDSGAVMNQNVVVTVTGTNDAPAATAKSGYTTDNWSTLTVTGAILLTGATDPDTGDGLTLSSVQDAVGGTVALSSGNAVFTPTVTATGPASFTYTVSDSKGGTATATASLDVTLRKTNGTANADTITGTAGKKAQIDGLAGNDTITAGSGGDVIIGGAGNDILNGAAGADTFRFRSGFGKDTINGFTATGTSGDKLLFNTNVFESWSHLLGATRQVGSDLVITYDLNNTITLKNVALANFTSDNAVFV